jgi:hypothetical protein
MEGVRPESNARRGWAKMVSGMVSYWGNTSLFHVLFMFFLVFLNIFSRFFPTFFHFLCVISKYFYGNFHGNVYVISEKHISKSFGWGVGIVINIHKHDEHETWWTWWTWSYIESQYIWRTLSRPCFGISTRRTDLGSSEPWLGWIVGRRAAEELEATAVPWRSSEGHNFHGVHPEIFNAACVMIHTHINIILYYIIIINYYYYIYIYIIRLYIYIHTHTVCIYIYVNSSFIVAHGCWLYSDLCFVYPLARSPWLT